MKTSLFYGGPSSVKFVNFFKGNAARTEFRASFRTLERHTFETPDNAYNNGFMSKLASIGKVHEFHPPGRALSKVNINVHDEQKLLSVLRHRKPETVRKWRLDRIGALETLKEDCAAFRAKVAKVKELKDELIVELQNGSEHDSALMEIHAPTLYADLERKRADLDTEFSDEVARVDVRVVLSMVPAWCDVCFRRHVVLCVCCASTKLCVTALYLLVSQQFPLNALELHQLALAQQTDKKLILVVSSLSPVVVHAARDFEKWARCFEIMKIETALLNEVRDNLDSVYRKAEKSVKNLQEIEGRDQYRADVYKELS